MSTNYREAFLIKIDSLAAAGVEGKFAITRDNATVTPDTVVQNGNQLVLVPALKGGC